MAPPQDPHAAPETDPDQIETRFREMALLEQEILRQDARIAALHTQTATLTTALAQAQRSVQNLGQTLAQKPEPIPDQDPAPKPVQDPVQDSPPDPAPADPPQPIHQDQTLEQLSVAVRDKERARFDLQEQVDTLTEALYEAEAQLLNQTQHQDLLARYETQTKELGTLTQLLQDKTTALQDRDAQIADLSLAQTSAPQGNDLSLGRPILTRMLADRDRARVAAGQPAPFPHLSAPTRGYVFIVTYGMSGATLLQGLLNRADGVSIRGENGNVLGLLADTWHQAATTQEAEQDAGSNPEPATGTDPFMWLNDLGWHLADSFVQTVLAPPADAGADQVPHLLGCREIRWPDDPGDFARRLDFLYGFFPDARFVFHTRPPAEVARSGWWTQQDPDKVVEFLHHRDALFDGYLKAHPGRGLRLHYPDYTTAPDQLEPLYQKLNLPFDTAQVRAVIADHLDAARDDPGVLA